MGQEYKMIVIFTRNIIDDAEIYGHTDYALMKGLSKELQQAYDKLGMGGRFQVQCIIKE